jgi:hypothetical protein
MTSIQRLGTVFEREDPSRTRTPHPTPLRNRTSSQNRWVRGAIFHSGSNDENAAGKQAAFFRGLAECGVWRGSGAVAGMWAAS